MTERPREIYVCITACGSPCYHEVAELAARSVLKYSEFNVVFGSDQASAPQWATESRIRYVPLRQNEDDHSPLFLAKFRTLEQAVNISNAAVFIQLDADAMFVAPIGAKEIFAELDGFDFAMVEQTTITGSGLGRDFFLDHYLKHTLRWLRHPGPAPDATDFRYYNSGLVMAHHRPLERFLEWAAEVRTPRPAERLHLID